jgi:hypothetical protein
VGADTMRCLKVNDPIFIGLNRFGYFLFSICCPYVFSELYRKLPYSELVTTLQLLKNLFLSHPVSSAAS